jgi:hypothetical protein
LEPEESLKQKKSGEMTPKRADGNKNAGVRDFMVLACELYNPTQPAAARFLDLSSRSRAQRTARARPRVPPPSPPRRRRP